MAEERCAQARRRGVSVLVCGGLSLKADTIQESMPFALFDGGGHYLGVGEPVRCDERLGRMPEERLRKELLAMAEADEALRVRLGAEGVLSGGYHPEMRALHARHAARLSSILEVHGWPSKAEVGADGQSAAWLILQHSIDHPDLMRTGLRRLREPPACTEVDAARVAMLEDRIHVLEGHPQRFGTQHDWDEDGMMSPLAVADPARVDALRESVGLPPLGEQTRELRERAAAEGQKPPASYLEYQRESEEWARGAGWRA